MADYDPLGSWRWLRGGLFLCKQLGIGLHLLPSFVVDAELPLKAGNLFCMFLVFHDVVSYHALLP